MLFKPDSVREIWDTWLYYHERRHYLFTLHKREGDVWDGITLSVSDDGVHFKDQGVIIQKRPDANWLGTGATWRVGDLFYLNFSEDRGGVQTIFFARSKDMLHWEIMPDNVCALNPDWYDATPQGRWDCIWPVKMEEGGYVGYLTARPLLGPPGSTCASVGMVRSQDGIHWQAAPPPLFDWEGTTILDVGEVGAVKRIGGQYHLLMGMNEERLGNRVNWREGSGQMGMYHFVADAPEGPFRPVKKGFRLLNSPDWMTYFCRFYKVPGELLICHHSWEKYLPSGPIYLAPLKRAVLGVHGEMYFAWWHGNDALLTDRSSVDLTKGRLIYQARYMSVEAEPNRLAARDNVGGCVWLAEKRLDLSGGTAITLTAVVKPGLKPMGAVGLVLRTTKNSTAFLIDTKGKTLVGVLHDNGSFYGAYSVENGIAPGLEQSILMLIRSSLIEIYLDERLIMCYSMQGGITGEWGLVMESAQVEIRDVSLFRMHLD